MDNLVDHLSKTFSISRVTIDSAIREFMSNNNQSPILNEPAVAYLKKQIEKDPIPSLSHEEILKQIESGLSSSDLITNILNTTDLTMKFLAEEVFEMTPKTFAKYKNENSSLPKRFLELSIKLIGLYQIGIEVFGTTEQFNNWAQKPAIGLNFNIPKCYFSTVTGIDYITEELQRIMMGYPV